MNYDEYEGKYAVYPSPDGSFACFIPRCPNCGRFVKAGEILMNREGEIKEKEPNATCKKCGQVSMPFEGYFSKEELEE